MLVLPVKDDTEPSPNVTAAAPVSSSTLSLRAYPTLNPDRRRRPPASVGSDPGLCFSAFWAAVLVPPGALSRGTDAAAQHSPPSDARLMGHTRTSPVNYEQGTPRRLPDEQAIR